MVDVREAISLLTYLISSAIIIGFGEGMRSANRRAQRYARSLEHNQLQLERAERHKDEFLATLAHELRNPLVPIRNALALVSRRAGVDPEIRKARDLIERQVRHITRLVDDLLDVSRIAAGRLHLQKQQVDLRSVLADAPDAGVRESPQQLRAIHAARRTAERSTSPVQVQVREASSRCGCPF